MRVCAWAGGAAVLLGLMVTVAWYRHSQRLVEVFDNGPLGGTPGPSEGMMWVGKHDLPPPGKSWKPIDPATLTDAQKQRIR
jgi:hypothetical protein